MENLFPKPDQANEGQEGEGDHCTALEDVCQHIIGAEHIDGQGEDGGDWASEQGPVDPAGGERDHAQPGHRHQGVVKPELDRPDHSAEEAGHDQQHRDPLRHVRGVDGGEREPVVAELAELLLAVL